VNDDATRATEVLLHALEAKERGELKLAIRHLQEAAALSGPEHYCHHLLCGWLIEDERTDEARAILEKIVREAPAVAPILDLAALVARDGDLTRARELYSAALALEPANAAARTMIGRLDAAIEDTARRLDRLMGDLVLEHRHPMPYVQFTGRPHGAHTDGLWVNGQPLDAWGFPNHAPPVLPKPANELRLFVLGDSTLFGGSDLDQTVPALLERELHGRGLERARVYNFSIVSACSRQMLVLLLLDLVDYAPDLVVVCNGGLDLLLPRVYDPRPGYPYVFFMTETLVNYFFDPRCADQPLTRAAFLNRAAADQLKLRYETGWLTDAWEEALVGDYLRSVEKLDRLAAAYGIAVALLLEPMVATRAQPTAEECDYLKPGTFDYYRRQYGRIRRALFGADAAPRRAASPMTVHDASAAFDGEAGTVFKDYMHFNPAGSRLMANYMAGVVADRLGAPSR